MIKVSLVDQINGAMQTIERSIALATRERGLHVDANDVFGMANDIANELRAFSLRTTGTFVELLLFTADMIDGLLATEIPIRADAIVWFTKMSAVFAHSLNLQLGSLADDRRAPWRLLAGMPPSDRH